MAGVTDNKIILITQKTRLENLIYRYNTESMAEFYVEHHGGGFADYKLEHETYYSAFKCASEFLESYGRLMVVEREFVPNLMFGKNDLVVVLGRDGLVANVMKYLTTQKLIGVNPDPKRWDGVLLPFSAGELPLIVPEAAEGKRKTEKITFAEAQLNDGQLLYGVNDLFIGQKGHASARYEISINGKSEVQSSSGIIVSTGLGKTGWLKSVITGARGIDSYFKTEGAPVLPEDFRWSSDYLFYTVREPYPSTSTGADIVFGKINKRTPMTVVSCMAENGVIFSDGMEQDYLEFNSGATATIGISEKSGNLIV